MDYEEISGEKLDKEEKRLIRTHYTCTNCEAPYDPKRKISVALLQFSLRWWHYPNSRYCIAGKRGSC